MHCPFCGTRRVAQGPDRTYRCGRCGSWFDDDPDEGGDYSNRNPGARLEREEARAERQRARKDGRR